MVSIAQTVEDIASATAFSGVVRVERDGAVALERAFGLADRRSGIANTPDTRFAVASGTKGLTALTVLALVADGRLAFETPARACCGTTSR